MSSAPKGTVQQYFKPIPKPVVPVETVFTWDPALEAAVCAKPQQCLVADELKLIDQTQLRWKCLPGQCRCHVLTMEAVTSAVLFFHEYVAKTVPDLSARARVKTWLGTILEWFDCKDADVTAVKMGLRVNDDDGPAKHVLADIIQVVEALEPELLSRILAYPFQAEAGRRMQADLITYLCLLATNPVDKPRSDSALFSRQYGNMDGRGYGPRKVRVYRQYYVDKFSTEMRKAAEAELSKLMTPESECLPANRQAGGTDILPALLKTLIPLTGFQATAGTEKRGVKDLDQMVNIVDGAFAFVRLERLGFSLADSLTTCFANQPDPRFFEIMVRLCHWQMFRYPEFAKPSLRTITPLPTHQRFTSFSGCHRRLLQFMPNTCGPASDKITEFMEEEERIVDSKTLADVESTKIELATIEEQTRFESWRQARQAWQEAGPSKLDVALAAIRAPMPGHYNLSRTRKTFSLWSY